MAEDTQKEQKNNSSFLDKGIDLVNNKKIPAKSSYPLQFGDIATFQTPGGGGMFSPSHRDENKVLEDVESELLSLKKAELIDLLK